MWIYLLLVLPCFAHGVDEVINYEGYGLFYLKPENSKQTEAIIKFSKENSLLGIDLWSIPKGFDMPATVLVSPFAMGTFKRFVKQNKINMEASDINVRKLIEDQQRSSSRESGMSWTRYHNLMEINAWLYEMEEKYPDKVKVIPMGYSYEGRYLTGVKISFGEGRKGIFIEGGIHAREWISPATVTYIINQILTNDDKEMKSISQSFDWYILPVTNPDGYEYTFTTNRLWRKTRKPYEMCHGADANRNWAYKWDEVGTSDEPCEQTYGGPEVFSESETYSLSEFFKTIGQNLEIFLSFHSYSQLLLIPYGDSEEHRDNYDDMRNISHLMVAALADRYGTEYKSGTPAEIIYPVSGDSMDYIKDIYKVPIVYTYELRDKGKYGFLLPPEQIIPNCEEVMDSLLAMFKQAEALNYFTLKQAD